MSRYLISGGSGFLGINLTRYLLARNHSVRTLDIVQFDYPEKNKIDAVLGDIRDRKMVDKCMEGIDVVVHCAAALPLYTKEEIFSTDIQGTTNVVESAFKHSVQRFIHISSTAVYGIPDHHPLFESDTLIGVGPYGESKIEAERICETFRSKDFCVPVIRPKTFIGTHRLGVFQILYDWVESGKRIPT